MTTVIDGVDDNDDNDDEDPLPLPLTIFVANFSIACV